ncbi:hypothetical protein ACFLXI_05195 [Chloroflexota bacterium]
MALGITLLEVTADSTNDVYIQGGSISPAGDSLLVVVAGYNDSAGNNFVSILDTFTGSGSWTLRGNAFNDDYDGGNNDSGCAIYTAQMGSTPGTGWITITLVNNASRKHLHVYEITGFDETTPVEQAATAIDQESSTLTVTLGATPAASSYVIGGVLACITDNDADVITAGTGFTEGGETTVGADNSGGCNLQSQYDLASADTTCDWSTLPITAYADAESGVAVEINEASTGHPDLVAVYGSLSFTGQVVGLDRDYILVAAYGSLSFSGQVVGLDRDYILAAAYGSLSLSGQAVGLKVDYVLSAAAGSLSFAGQDVDLVYSGAAGHPDLVAAAGSLSFTGQSVGLDRDYILAAASGSLSFTGQDVGLVRDYILAAASGSLSFTGQAVGLDRDYILAASNGSLSFAGQAVGITTTRTLPAAYGSISFAGQVVGLDRDYILSASYGSLSFAGQDVDLDYSGAAAHPDLVAAYGSLSFAGRATALIYSNAPITPDERIYTIVAESRVWVIPAEDRTVVIAAEDRTMIVVDENQVTD